MKRSIFILTTVLFSILLINCETGADRVQEKDIIFLRTDLGGCHDQNPDPLKRAGEEVKDTVIFTLQNDTLNVFVGLNYICCAPFVSDAVISQDSILLTLSDTCNFPEESCYCKCMCYYTWDFLFTDFGVKEYLYKILLNSPQEENQLVISEGSIELN